MEQRLPVQGAVLGDEEKDEPVHHAQDLAVESIRRERPGPKPLAQRRVAGMAREAPAENPQRPLHAPAQLPERAGALLLGLAGPLLQPAGLGPLALARRESRGMDDEPQQHEVRVDLAREHRLEVELEERLARQGLVVPQDAEPQPIGDDRPQVRVAAVEELLHQPVRVDHRRAALPRRPAVERETAPDEMHRHRTEEPPDGIGAAANLRAGGGRQEAEPQHAQQRQAPLVVGEAGAGLAFGQMGGGGVELAVVPAEPIPGVSDYFVEAFAGGETVVLGACAGEGGAAIDDTAEEIRGQEAAFGADGLELGAEAGHVALTSHQPRQQDVGAEQVDRQNGLDGNAAPSPGWRRAHRSCASRWASARSRATDASAVWMFASAGSVRSSCCSSAVGEEIALGLGGQ